MQRMHMQIPETRPPPGRTQVESRRLEKEHRDRILAPHLLGTGW